MLAGSAFTADNSPVFLSYFIENGSPLDWKIREDGIIEVQLLYDHERNSSNRACIHWNFLVEAEEGSEVELILKGFENIWNGMPGSAISNETSCYISQDGLSWEPVATERISDGALKIRLVMESSTVQVARLQPYTLKDLAELEDRIFSDSRVKLIPIGRTVCGRELKIIQAGDDNAPHRILIRARAHPWEPGGNWVIEGLLEEYLNGEESQGLRESYSLYLLPMANMDGVYYGRTRFNTRGMDLNRKWDQPADPLLSPENKALERFIESLIEEKKKPDLGIDFHNDESGLVHVSRPNVDLARYLRNMELMGRLLRENTWFTEGTTGGDFRNPGSFGEGMIERYGIDAFIYELNANRIAGLGGKVPESGDWRMLGRKLAKVFDLYFKDFERN